MKWLWLVAVSFLLAGCQFSLAGDVTPPPTSEQPAATSVAVEYPAATPDPQNGAANYLQNCAPCHGATGLGDGPQASQLPFAPAPIGSSDLAAAAAPAGWYQNVTIGNLDRYMPPFAAKLSVQERWDVLAYVFSLSADPVVLQRGQDLARQYQDEISSIVDGNNFAKAASVSRQQLANDLRAGLPDLSTEDLQSLAIYLQALSFGFSVPVAAATATDEAATTDTGAFSGSVIDGTDGELASGLQAILFAYDNHATQAFTRTTKVGPDGSYLFTDVPLAVGRTFFVEVDYLGQSYFSDFLTTSGPQNVFAQPITVYETTADTSQLAIETLTLVFDFTDAGKVRVAEQFVISNIGNRAVAPVDNTQPVLLFNLPSGATNLVFQEGKLGERYIAAETGFGDLRAVLPGQNNYQQLFALDLPYNSGLKLPISVTLPARSVVVLIPEGTVSLAGSNFQDAGTQDIHGSTYHSYVSNGALFAGDQISLQLKGANPAGSSSFAFLNDDRLLVGLGALAVAVGAVWVWLLRSQPRNSANAIMDEIIRLDAAYKKRMLGKRDYSKRRSALKAELRRALENK